jgi:hypothetical protein
MLVLDTTTAILRLVTSVGCDVQVQVSYTDDLVESAGPPRVDVFQSESQSTLITTATTTTICDAPAASTTRRNIKGISIRNAHVSVSVTITVEHYDGTTAIKLQTVTLDDGEFGSMNGDGVWFWYDANGAVKAGTGPGRLLRVTILTAGSSHVMTAFTSSARTRGKAGGGGGGGCTSVASAAAAAGGGSEGGSFEKLWTVMRGVGYSYTIGAAGAGVSGAAGNNGGNTTFSVGGVTATAFGGIGGPVDVAANALQVSPGAASPAVSTNGDVNHGGEPGQYGVVVNVTGPIAASGKGGGPGGGVGLVAVGNGNNAVGVGNGGGGAMTGASAVRTGGNGSAGMIIVEEYS